MKCWMRDPNASANPSGSVAASRLFRSLALALLDPIASRGPLAIRGLSPLGRLARSDTLWWLKPGSLAGGDVTLGIATPSPSATP